jgi:lactoylglutathione lyase
MRVEINLVTIWTEAIEPMKHFYHSILGFPITNDLGTYVEFHNPGVRFALCQRTVMHQYSEEYKTTAQGQSFELAFPCDSVQDLDQSYERLLEQGAKGIHPPRNMPWNQRTALFADPEGNIHELFTELT